MRKTTMGNEVNMEPGNADLLFSLACRFSYSLGVLYHVLDDIFTGPVNERIRQWYSEPGGSLAEWQYDNAFRTSVLVRTKLRYEAISDTYLKAAHDVLMKAAKQAYDECDRVEMNMWYYFIYCRWCLHVLNEFDALMHRKPILDTENYRVYKEDFELFEKVKNALQLEYPDWDSMNIDPAQKDRLENILESTAQELSNQWLKTVYGTYGQGLSQLAQS